MVLFKWLFVCFIVYWPTLCTANDEGVSGFMKAKDETYEASKEKSKYDVYYFAGEEINFTCQKTSELGVASIQYFVMKDNKLVDQAVKLELRNGLASLSLKLTPANNDSNLYCSIDYKPTGKTVEAILTLKLGNKPVRSFWIIVFSVVAFLIVLAVGLWIWVTYRDRKRHQQDASMTVTYGDRNSIENLDPRASHPNEPTSVTNIQPTDALKNDMLSEVSVQNGEPSDSTVENCEPTRKLST